MNSIFNHQRNGTSQPQRSLDALRPDYFLPEERSIADLISYAKNHAEILSFFNINNEIDENNANWSAFLDGNPQEMVDYLNNPTIFDDFPEKKAKYSRPHLVLFLVFLKLLRFSHEKVNGVTKRQLDFYFREALRFSTNKGVPDHVHILANVDRDATQVLIPKGTLLEGGADGQGNPVRYATDFDFVADHTQIARLMSLYVKKQVTDIPQRRLQGKSEADGGFLSILKLTYRKAGTADFPKTYPDNSGTDRPLDQKLIEELDELEKTIKQTFRLRIAAFQRLMRDYHDWENKSLWSRINGFLLKTYNLNNNSDQGLDIFSDAKDFDANFKTALGFGISGKEKEIKKSPSVFDGIPDVDNLYEFYENYLRFPDDVKILNLISEKFKQEPAEFESFMKARHQVLGLMKNIHQYLKSAAKTDESSFADWNYFQYKKDETLAESFRRYVDADSLENDQDLVKYENDLKDIEKYFGMSAEDYFFVRSLYLRKNIANVPNWKWQKADSLLIRAFQKSAISDAGSVNVNHPPVPEIVRWKNVYAAPDAAVVKPKSAERAEDFSHWKSFGAAASETSNPEAHYAADIGWAISSPALNLSEGVRDISLKFTFRKNEFEAQRETLASYFENCGKSEAVYPFRLEISTGKGWISFAEWTFFRLTKNEPALEIGVQAKEDAEPFAPLANDANTFPQLRLILNKDAYVDVNKDRHVYELLRKQFLEQVELGIKVTGLRKLIVQNKDGSVDPKKPFDIFGSVPETGNQLYVTHPELAAQKLDRLAVNLEWKNLPAEGLVKYYEPYGSGLQTPISDDSFQVQISLVEARRKLNLLSPPQNLFPGSRKDAQNVQKNTQTIQIEKIPGKFGNDEVYARQPFAKTTPEVTDSDRYLELELQNQDFLHNRYAAIAQKLANDSLVKSFKDGKYDPVPPPVLPEPFKPTLKSIQIDYETSLKIDWKSASASADDKIAHVEPFGLHFLPDNQKSVPFLPDYEKEGGLYIGLKNLHPPANVSFLFQLAEGSANPEFDPSRIAWSYLSGNEWIKFEKEQLLTDTTGGFLNSGLIQIYIPENASFHHQRMPDGLYWIRAEVERFSESLSDCIDIRTQAVSATWIDSGKTSDHLDQPLNAGTIRRPLEPIAGLSSVIQPFSSFLGKPAEGDDQLYRRASSILRHKGRALTVWDYENIILEEFPDIFRAKVLPADPMGEAGEPGRVKIVVIPDVRKRKPFDPFEPKMPISRLREIQDFLQKRAAAFARIHLQNARFLYLQLRFRVRFKDMNNFGFFAGKLQQELLEYLAPWAFDKPAEIVFGGKITSSVIVDFIKGRSYVDYIERPLLRLLERQSGGEISVMETQPLDDEGQLHITEPDVVVVSAHQHFIEYLTPSPKTPIEPIRQGIGFAKLEYDFRIPNVK